MVGTSAVALLSGTRLRKDHPTLACELHQLDRSDQALLARYSCCCSPIPSSRENEGFGILGKTLESHLLKSTPQNPASHTRFWHYTHFSINSQGLIQEFLLGGDLSELRRMDVYGYFFNI